MKKTVLTAITLLIFSSANFFCQEQNRLLIKPTDLRLVPESSDNFSDSQGYHLYIRKIPGIESIMLTETTKDPIGKSDNYAYRAPSYNKINGDEIRYLNGKPLSSEYSKYSLIDSTAEPDPQFGQAFHIYIPHTIQFGYPWARNGSLTIGKGTFLNIRSFSKKYGDYTGQFYDNPYMFDLGKAVIKKPAEKPLPAPEPSKQADLEPIPEPEVQQVILTDDYNPLASTAFDEMSESITYSKGPQTIVQDIMDSLMKIQPKDNTDVVFVIDATGSMKDDIEQLRKEWVPKLLEGIKEFKNIRLGLLLYRDYGGNFNYKKLPVKFYDFTTDISLFTKNLNGFVIRGTEGGDIPEAVYEAIFAGVEFYQWRSDAYRKIILIGDAEPHPTPRGTGKYSKQFVLEKAKQAGIKIDAIITPDEKDRRGR